MACAVEGRLYLCECAVLRQRLRFVRTQTRAA